MADTAPSIDLTSADFLHHIALTQSAPLAAVYQQAVHSFLKYLATQPGSTPSRTALIQTDIQVFRNYLAYLQDHYSAETEHGYFRAIIALTKYAESSAQTAPNLSSKLNEIAKSFRRKKQRAEPQIPREIIHHVQSFLATYPLPEPDPDASYQRERLQIMRDKALIFTIVDTGLKTSELTALRVDNFDPAKSQILFKNVEFETTTQTTTALDQYLRERGPIEQQSMLNQVDLPLFARHDKRASTNILAISRWTIRNVITYWANLAQADNQAERITPSLIRHHFVMSTLEKTDDLQVTQMLAGHKDKSTTRHYLKQRKSADKA